MRQKVHLPLLMFFCILGSLSITSGEIPYCSTYSSDKTSCLACQTGYSTVSSTICQADCDELFYFDSSTKTCSSLCSLSEIGNDTTKTCDTINPCPNYSAIGQSFHTDVLNTLIIHTSTSELITSCSSDTSILVWDAQSGGQKANFQGHSVAPLNVFFLESSDSHLLSFSASEVIIWDYSKAIILYKSTISYGQLTANSEVNQSTNSITSFGFQGEFFIVNYVTLTSSKFIGHSNIVETVLFLGSSYLISSAKDKLILLWQVSNTNLPTYLTQLAIKKIAINYLSVSGNLSSFLFALGGSNSEDNNQIIIAYIDTSLPPADTASQFKLKTQDFQDHTSSIIDFILDTTNNYFISYSADEIIIYQGLTNVNYILEFTLKKRLSADSLLGGLDSVISSCALVDKTKFVIGTLYGQVYLFTYSFSSAAILSPSQPSNQLEIQREQTNSNFMFQYSSSTDVLFVYSEQVLAVNFSTLDVSYIINNWITPPVLKHSSKVLDIDYSELSQIMVTVSTDSYCFVYDFISTKLLTIITHPSNINISKTAALVTPLKVAVVRDLNVCVSYIDFSLICYDPISGNINYRYTGTTEAFTFLKQDYARNYILAAGQSLIVVIDLNNNAVFSQFSKTNQFSVINFQPAAQLLYTSTPYGYYIKFNYPIVSIDKEADQSSLNTNNQVINGWTLDDANNMGITFYNAGLVILIYADLSPLKNIQYTSAPTTCGINYPYLAICATITGGVVGWSLYTAYEFEQQLLDFPIEKGLFSFKYGKAYLLINYQAYGSGILIGNLQYVLGEQTFDTSRTITNFIIEESRMRVLTTMGNGDVSNFHFTPVASSLVEWKDSADTSIISRIIVYQESYKLVILSVGITIYDYLNSAIYKTIQLHDSLVTNALIDKTRNLLISFNDASSKNLFVWDFIHDSSIELVGHTKSVTGIIIFSTTSSLLLSYSADGYIIIWQYLTGTIQKKLNLNSASSAAQLFLVSAIFSSTSTKSLIINLSLDSTVSIYDYSSGDITSQITLPTLQSRIVLDETYQRIFAYDQNSIQVYSYLTGLKITELLGFDGAIGSDIQFEDDYIIAHGQLVISSFDRNTLSLLYSGKSTQKIYQTSVLGSYIALISDSLNDIIKLWNYQTGTMLQDMTNSFYPIAVNGIQADKEAKIFFVRNVKNYIFSFNPYSSSVSKVSDFMILPSFSSQTIKEILIDKQSNLFFAYNDNEIMLWRYYAYLGKKGQEISLPSNSQIHIAYHPDKDMIYYGDIERNLWQITDNSVKYAVMLESRALDCVLIGNVLIIREYSQIKSYDESFNVVSAITVSSSQIISNDLEYHYIFAVTFDQKIIKIAVNQVDFSLTQKITYTLNTYSLYNNALSRVSVPVINIDKQHLIVGTISGQITILNYATDAIFANITDHTASVRVIVFDNQLNQLFSCSSDGTVRNYLYTTSSITAQNSLFLGSSIEQLILDSQYSRLLVWNNLQTIMYVMDSTTLSISMKLLAPADVNCQIIFSSDFNKYAVFTQFQVNIYSRADIIFITSIRFPSDLNDIQAVTFIDGYNILITAQTSIRVYSFSATSKSLVTQLDMEGTNLAITTYTPDSRSLTLKGVNYLTAFNYTYILFDAGIDSTSTATQLSNTQCFANIDNPTGYFTLRQYLSSQETAFKYFKASSSISSVKFNLLYGIASSTSAVEVFFPQISSTLSYTKNVVFSTQSSSSSNQNRLLIDSANYRVLINLLTVKDEYSLPSLTLHRYSLSLAGFTTASASSTTSTSQITFGDSTQTFIFKDGLIDGSTLSSSAKLSGLYFADITSLVIENLTIQNVYFTSILANSALLTVNITDIVVIKHFVMTNCSLENQSFMQIISAKKVIIESINISNVTFITTSSSSSSFTASVFHIINSKNVTISSVSVTEITKSDTFNIFTLEGDVNTSIQALNASNLVNCRALFYTQHYSEINYSYQVKNDKLTISNMNLTNLSIDSLSQLDISAQYVEITELSAKNVICPSCTGAVIKANAPSFILFNSTLTDNQGFQGGALQLEECVTTCQISLSTISNNKAVQGGGIYLSTSEITFKDSNIQFNTAYIGGGIRYAGLIPKQILQQTLKTSNNLISSNTATVFGINIGSYPRYLKFVFGDNNSTIAQISNSTSDYYAQTYSVNGFMSGNSFLFSVVLKDEEDNTLIIDPSNLDKYPDLIREELNSYQIQVFVDNELIQLNSETLITLSKYNSTSNSFVFDKLVINSKPNSNNHFYLKANNIYMPSAANSSLFYQPSFSVFMNISFRKCRIGEIYVKQQSGQLEHCKACQEGTYSLIEPQDESESITCKICPSEAVKCYENTILLKNGYWRENNSTDLIVECSNAKQNCQGEASTSREYCVQGYIGPLCETCDVIGDVWGENFSKIGAYECQQCSEMAGQYVFFSFAFVMIVIYVWIGVKQAYKNSKKKVIGFYLRMMGVRSIGTSDSADQTSVYLKFLMHYLYISSIIKRMNIQIPASLDVLQTHVSSPVASMKSTSDCYKASAFQSKLNQVFSQQIISQILPIIYTLSTALIYITLIGSKKMKYSKSFTICGLVFLYIFISPDIISGLVAASACRHIGDRNYIIDDVSEYCLTSSHIQFLILFCIPFYIIWIFFYPLLLFYQIYKKRKTLNFISARLAYGFLYQEYRLKAFYWEFVKITLKTIVTIINNFFLDEEVTKACIISTFILLYLLLTIRQNPFESFGFNRCDKFSHIFLIIILQISAIVTVNDYAWLTNALIVIFYFLHYSFIAFLLLKIFRTELYRFMNIITTHFPMFRQKFPKIYEMLNISSIDKEVTFKNWRKVYYHLFKTKNLLASQTRMLLRSHQDSSPKFYPVLESVKKGFKQKDSTPMTPHSQHIILSPVQHSSNSSRIILPSIQNSANSPMSNLSFNKELESPLKKYLGNVQKSEQFTQSEGPNPDEYFTSNRETPSPFPEEFLENEDTSRKVPKQENIQTVLSINLMQTKFSNTEQR